MPTFRQSFFNFFRSDSHLEQLTPTAQRKALEEAPNYRKAIGFSDKITFGEEAFKEHATKRAKDSNGFKVTVGKDDDEKDISLKKALKGNPELKKQLDDIFVLDPKYSRAQDRYESEIKAFQELVTKVPVEYSVSDIRQSLELSQSNARKAIEMQHQLEKKKLEALGTPEGIEKLKTDLNLESTEETKKIHEQMKADLDKTHKEQLDAFNKSTSDNMLLVDKASSKENERLLFTAHLEKLTDQLSEKQKKEMREEIDRVRTINMERRDPEWAKKQNVGIVDCDAQTISAINPDDLKFIRSITGKKIEHKEDGWWHVEMSSRIASPFYYLSNASKPAVDVLTMAQAVRASGFDSIELKVAYKDPDTQRKRAMQAYEAGLAAGFPPDKIKLTDGNGVEIKLDELYKNHSARRQIKENAAQTTRQQLETVKKDIDDSNPKANAAHMKEEIHALREKQTAKPLTAAQKKQEEEDAKEIEEAIKPSMKP